MARFTQYPAATDPTDYTDATNFLIESPDGDIKLASLEGLSTFFCSTYCASVTIPSADVLTLNSVPIEIVSAQGAGTAIQVMSASFKMVYGTTQYATNYNIQLLTSGAIVQQAEVEGLNASVSNIRAFEISHTNVPTGTQIIENAALNVTVETGNPTAGDSDITVYVYYRVIIV